MFQLDVEKIQVLAQMMGEIPCDYGRNLITVTFHPGFKSGHFNYLLNWKRDTGEREFRSLDDALKILQELIDQAGPAQYTD